MAANITITRKARGTGNYVITSPDGVTTALSVTPTEVEVTGPFAVTGTLSATSNPSSTNTVVEVASFTRKTTGVAGIGLGLSTSFNLESSAGTTREAGRTAVAYTDATNGSEDASFTLQLIRAGALDEAYNVSSIGAMRLKAGLGVHDVSAPSQAAHIATVTQSIAGAINGADTVGKAALLTLLQELQLKLEALRVTVQAVGFNAAV